MEQKKKLSDTILEEGENFQVDAMEDYDDRVSSGEFAEKTDEEIRRIYFEEALADEEDQEMYDQYQAMNDQDEAENG